MPPKALGCGSGTTCWRRMRDWQQDGIWDLIHFALLDWLSRDGQLDWSRAAAKAGSVWLKPGLSLNKAGFVHLCYLPLAINMGQP